MMGLSISINDNVNLQSQTKLDGFQIHTANATKNTDRYIFIRDMTYTIYTRIFTTALNALAMTESQESVIKASAFDMFTPYSEGFIRHLVKAASTKSTSKIYAVHLSDGVVRFTDQRPQDQTDEQALQLDFSKFEEARMIASIVNMMFSAMDAAATGMKASKTLYLKLEKLADHIADKKIKKAIEEQVRSFDESMRDSTVVFTSAGSDAKFMEFNVEPSTKAMQFCFGLLSTITGLPSEFFDGLQGGTMSDTGASTDKAIYRASENYARRVIIPFIKEVFGESLTMKPLLQNLEQLAGMISFVETTDALDLKEKQLVLSNFGLQGNGLEQMEKDKKKANKNQPVVGDNQEQLEQIKE